MSTPTNVRESNPLKTSGLYPPTSRTKTTSTMKEKGDKRGTTICITGINSPAATPPAEAVRLLR